MTATATKKPTPKVTVDDKLDARIVQLTKSGLTRKDIAAKLGARNPGDLAIMVVQVRHGLVETTNAYILRRAGKQAKAKARAK